MKNWMRSIILVLLAAWLLGAGESSDGHHMSSPHPEGAGAAAP